MPDIPETFEGTPSPTRQALIDAAIDLFGQDGFRGTSTRAIARKADTNVASIAYHFGGKDALRIACGEEIAGRLGAALQAVGRIEAETREQAQASLEALISAFLRFLTLDPAAADRVRFLLRELAEAGPVIDTIYRTAIGPRHAEICHLWAMATGQPADGDETRLAVFSMVGQVLYFRIGQAIVCRRMGWDGYGPTEVAQVEQVVLDNVRTAIAFRRKEA